MITKIKNRLKSLLMCMRRMLQKLLWKPLGKSLRGSLQGSWFVQLIAVVLYVQYLVAPEHVVLAQDRGHEYAFIEIVAAVVAYLIANAWAFAISAAISMGIGYLTAKKPPKPSHSQPIGLAQFNVPTAEEGRSIQVLFGKRYIGGPNVVWYGDLKSDPIVVRV